MGSTSKSHCTEHGKLELNEQTKIKTMQLTIGAVEKRGKRAEWVKVSIGEKQGLRDLMC